MNYQYNITALIFDIAAMTVSLLGGIAAGIFCYFESRLPLKFISIHIMLSMFLYSFIQAQWIFGGQLYGEKGSLYEIMWSISAIMFIIDTFTLIWFLRLKRGK